MKDDSSTWLEDSVGCRSSSVDVTCASLVLNFWAPVSSNIKYLHELKLSFKSHNFARKPPLS